MDVNLSTEIKERRWYSAVWTIWRLACFTHLLSTLPACQLKVAQSKKERKVAKRAMKNERRVCRRSSKQKKPWMRLEYESVLNLAELLMHYQETQFPRIFFRKGNLLRGRQMQQKTSTLFRSLLEDNLFSVQGCFHAPLSPPLSLGWVGCIFGRVPAVTTRKKWANQQKERSKTSL